ncbi:MAG: DUF2889 domain-containing protein [Desulfitobacteriaceae bacterium]|nr:DUF2889 domain-containing protein [Desulfitobacteriaceae bacterium]MDD4345533.1 DUF2889 domain-containing protein [Desulfitobacteriaceae bacterium]MDD4401658.1 DUF2889 domain-containing protein [Desulfitobacteriaceae bacterium]
MKNLFQRNWYIEVRRSNDRVLKAVTSYLDTYREAAARLLIDTNSFIVEEAIWEEQRSAGPISINSRQVTPLLGSEAYFSSGPKLKEVTAFLNDPLAGSLFSESIKAIIQAETFLWEKRDYSSEEEYENKWMEFYAGSCRYYSNPDRITRSWYTHVGESKRDGNLFIRFKTQSLLGLGNDHYLLTGNLSDSFHELNVNLKLNGFTVEDTDGILLRSPDRVCREATILLNNLHGNNLRNLNKKEIANILGKGQGCVHLIDLVNDCAQILELFKL